VRVNSVNDGSWSRYSAVLSHCAEFPDQLTFSRPNISPTGSLVVSTIVTGPSCVNDIKSQIKKLSRRELAVFGEWFAQFDAEARDRELEADAGGGKLNSRAERALRGHDARRSTNF